VSAASADVLRWGGERARAGRWRGDERVALLTPLPDAPLLSAPFVRRCLDILAAQGYTRVLTGALSPLEQTGFLAVGFDIEERLHLLAMDLDEMLSPVPIGLPLRRVGRRRRDAVLAVDRAAFPAFWQLDQAGLEDALRATPSTRFRVALAEPSSVVGYAICGRASGRGFVQRLAVDPACQGSGAGRRLLLDGLHWMRDRGVRRAVVNTQIGNERALSLYQRIGFRQQPTGLSVLSAGLP
jgi:ribosomal protein S18 acetylase RimI-like enzyme